MDKAGSSMDSRGADALGAAFCRFAGQGDGGHEALLDGILCDASGLPMRSTHSERPRFYITVPSGDAVPAVTRVPIVWLDKFVERLLRRLRLLPPDWHKDDVRALLRRVSISDTAVVLDLNRPRSLTNWRRQGAVFEKSCAREIMRAIRHALPPSATLTGSGDTLVIQAPRITSRS